MWTLASQHCLDMFALEQCHSFCTVLITKAAQDCPASAPGFISEITEGVGGGIGCHQSGNGTGCIAFGTDVRWRHVSVERSLIGRHERLTTGRSWQFDPRTTGFAEVIIRSPVNDISLNESQSNARHDAAGPHPIR